MDAKKIEEIKDLIKNKTVLKGVVRQLQKYKTVDIDMESLSDVFPEKNNNNSDLLIEMDGYEVVIPSKEAVVFYRSYTTLSLVGEQVLFVLTDIYPEEGVVFGSMKLADEIRKAPLFSKLYAGNVLSGTIVNFTSAGAYIDVGCGVQGLVRDDDYGNGKRRIEDDYKKFMEIKVHYSHTTSRGTIIFIPEEKAKIATDASSDISPIVKGQIYKGRIKDVFPDRVYVTIRGKMDCMCSVPLALGSLRKNEAVSVKITRASGNKLRGVIVNRLNI